MPAFAETLRAGRRYGTQAWPSAAGIKMFHVKHRPPHILLINPWITDFAAYNFWIKPLGLLQIASFMRKTGFRVTLIDCLDFYKTREKCGDGKFFKTKIQKPGALKTIPRQYSQYGMSEETLLKELSSMEKPDVIGITSGMTYWYPGVFRVNEIVKELLKGVPVILGGIYATLCYEHALGFSGADIVLKGSDTLQLSKIISELTNFEFCNPQSAFRIDNLPYPAFDLYPQLDFISIATSRGCPFRCSYCASLVLANGFIRRDPFEVVAEIEYWATQYEIRNIAFCDDALLINPSEHIIPILKEVIRRGIQCSFHAPNGLHIREIDEEVAELLFRNHFKTIRLGFETSNESIQNETGGKVDNKEFKKAVRSLKRAGYLSEEIGAYIMAGLPGQRVEEIEESIAFVREIGAKPVLVEYSPIPHTPLFEKA